MAQGLRIWDEHGNLTVDSDFRMSRTLGQIYINQINDGIINVPQFNQGTPWFYAVVDWSNIFYDNSASDRQENTITISSDNYNIQWIWYHPRLDKRGYYRAAWVIYGVY
ncbi:hypothetical protein [Bartonella tamiae]|uniref:Uncharacterized protein n=1 Tax=Bartonella tamiae Th239 TaxID=1094558 RepID=J1K2I0_9HYPH|nr:hypothetical protein [Bartonella tamiae]EJF91692.1 hypothetical protein ME5_00071 [Bartonella tamiae Th239]